MPRLCPFLSEKHPFYTLDNQEIIPMVFTSYQHIFFLGCLDKMRYEVWGMRGKTSPLCHPHECEDPLTVFQQMFAFANMTSFRTLTTNQSLLKRIPD